ncbi:Transposable element Tc1 transposase [Anthophora retusa]
MPKIRELTPAERSQIFNRRLKGETLRKIASDFNVSAECVRKVVNRLETNGTAENLPRSGRPRKTTVRQDRMILREVHKNRNISSKQLKAELNLPIKETQIRMRIKEAGYHSRVSRKRPLISKRNAQRRLAFAKQFINKPIDFWKNVIFTDESKFELRSNKRRQLVWRKVGESFKPSLITPTVKHGGGAVLVWGCFSAAGVGNLQFIEGILTGEKYVHILQQNLTVSAEKMNIQDSFILKMDNDPKHVCKVAKKYYNENNIQLLPWPAQSPDLNPIEHMWDHLNRNVPEHCRNNKQLFQRALLKAWSEIDQNTINILIESMPKRLQEVINNRGYQTSY